MIWQEFRAHNICFALRSVACFTFAWVGRRAGTPAARRLAIGGSTAACLGALVAADEITKRLRVDSSESTTATMPYPPSWRPEVVRRFKAFYALSQYMATLGCLMCTNLAYPFIIALPIQLASLLMTLVRKGLLSAAGYHLLYAGSLCLPYCVAALHAVKYGSRDVVVLLATASALLFARRQGASKYALWGPTFALRALWGDRLLHQW
mmetsp:Transcript_8292/g.28214  ORF Transcript_8292/g.28214 Transcript_8292/m.28214 type:complete len:208 (+) Transcript_8292:302-925(+)